MISNKFQILIVEDTPVDMKVLTEVLRSMSGDFEIRCACSYQEAKNNFQESLPDLILLDINLPDQDGFYFLQEVQRNTDRDVLVILVSNFLNRENKLKGFELGITDFVYKPIIAEELKLRVAIQYRLKKIKEDQDWAAQKTNEGIKLLYKDLENKNKQLEQLDQLKDEFINNVSHELRTPLTIIQESVSIITDGLLGGINEKQSHHLKGTLENIDRLSKIINDLLDISTIENKKLNLFKENVNIVDLVQGVVQDFTPLVEKKGLEIKCIVPQERVDVFVDKERIIQVLVNLVNNAYKFTDKGKIYVSVAVNGDAVECRVKDTGIGIDASDVPRLFSKFDQIGRQHGAGAKGTGLGLSIAKGIIELHDGQIKVESRPGEGTLFTVILPASPVSKQYKNLMDCLGEVTRKYSNYSVLAFYIENLVTQKDELLDELVALINKQIHRKSDHTVKDNGSVFVVLSDTKKEDALIVLDRLRGAIDEMNWGKSRHDFKGFTIKIINFPLDVCTEVELIHFLKIYKEAVK